jgi:ATP-dependent helicase/nuclease subunit B
MMNADAFRDWVDDTLEHATFLPAAPQDDAPQVVITPLARAMLRPFGAVVLPGADDRRLGAAPSADGLLGDAVAAGLGVPSVAQRRSAELRAFAQLLDVPRITLMRRRIDGSDPLADSPLVERLALALATQGRGLAAWHDPRIEQPVTPTPIRMSAPAAPSLLPAHLSASACEALRACPYRFFALQMLRLREDDELEREIEKRDYGTWLHAVLFDFHAGRPAPAEAEVETRRLMQIAEARCAAQGMADADFLPFAASFRAFAPRYVAWLHERDRAGAQWQHGEHELTAAPAELGGIAMRGVIDRIDAASVDGTRGIEMIDYKTGSASGLKDKLRDRLEDTQLAFYAALMRAHTALTLKAGYLAVDGSKALEEIEHPEVADSAARLVDGLAHDLQRLRAGAGLPALGEGASCDYCAARGVCRRDHWADDPVPEPAA